MTPSTPETPTRSRWTRRRVLDFVGENGFIVIFILWCLLLALATDNFLTWRNIFTVLQQSAIVSIVAIGEMLVLLTGAMDVSLAAILSVGGLVAASLLLNNLPPLPAVVLGVGAGGLIGLVNGLIVTKSKINSIIATLGMLSILGGLALMYTQGQTIYGPPLDSLDFLSSGDVAGVRVPIVVMFVLYALFHFILSRTLFGAQLYAVGSNEKAAWLSGLRVDRIRIAAFAVAGVLAGLGGVMQVARQGSATALMGDEFLFPILTTVVLAGVSLSGGQGRLLNVLVAAIFLVTITNGMVLLGLSVNAQRVASGVILIVALSLDRLRQRVR
ncbi:Ribose import permease protein RbsC [Thermoflexales bacterium]|nr:Ribose import permease protein RbsC [Thermoflexales bacterium]